MNIRIDPTDFLSPEFEQALESSLEKVLPKVIAHLPAPESSMMLLSANQAAKTLGICTKSLWSQTAPRGPIPSVKIGSRVLYSPADLQAWIDGQKRKGVNHVEK